MCPKPAQDAWSISLEETKELCTTSLAQAALLEQVRSRAANGVMHVSCASCWTTEARCEGPPPPPGASRSEFAGRPGRWLALLDLLPPPHPDFLFLGSCSGWMHSIRLICRRVEVEVEGGRPSLGGRAGASSRHVFRPKAAHRDGFDPDTFCHRPAISSRFSSQSLSLSDRTRYSLRSPSSLALARRSRWLFSRPFPFRPSSFSSDGFLDRLHVVQLAQAAVDRPALLAPRTYRPRPVRQPQQVSQVSPFWFLRQAALPRPFESPSVADRPSDVCEHPAGQRPSVVSLSQVRRLPSTLTGPVRSL